MQYFVISLVAFVASGLTMFSAFGLATIVTPAFAIFFPIEIAIGLTAIVHFLNNIFKFGLLGKHVNAKIVFQFGIPAIFGSFIGAQMLIWLSYLEPLYQYQIVGNTFSIMPIKLIIAVLIIIFALAEILPILKKISISKKYLPLGGVISGFFGGLSGHQGALRGAFLIKYDLSKEAYVATGITIAILVDIVRLMVYGLNFSLGEVSANLPLLTTATIAACLGAFIGNKLLKKITMKMVQNIVAVMLFIIAITLGIGLI